MTDKSENNFMNNHPIKYFILAVLACTLGGYLIFNPNVSNASNWNLETSQYTLDTESVPAWKTRDGQVLPHYNEKCNDKDAVRGLAVGATTSIIVGLQSVAAGWTTTITSNGLLAVGSQLGLKGALTSLSSVPAIAGALVVIGVPVAAATYVTSCAGRNLYHDYNVKDKTITLTENVRDKGDELLKFFDKKFDLGKD